MDIRLRQMTGAFLRRNKLRLVMNGQDMLLMKRAETMRIAPGLWAGIGGHVEPEEISDPVQCVLREIEEETGIVADSITGIRLQAVVHRQRGQEIRVQYIYFGYTETRDLGYTAEGALHWIRQSAVLEKAMSAANRFVLEKYFQDGPSDDIWVGVLGNDGGRPKIQWSSLADWE